MPRGVKYPPTPGFSTWKAYTGPKTSLNPAATTAPTMPRKSNISTTSAPPGAEDGTPLGKERERERDGVNIEDLSLPRTMVQRLAKGVLPPNTQIQKDAITALSKGATVYVNHLSNAANTNTHAAGRKTISPADVFLALRDTEYEFMIPRLEAELAKYNEVQTGKRNEYRRKVRESTGGVRDSVGRAGGNTAAGEEATNGLTNGEGTNENTTATGNAVGGGAASTANGAESSNRQKVNGNDNGDSEGTRASKRRRIVPELALIGADGGTPVSTSKTTNGVGVVPANAQLDGDGGGGSAEGDDGMLVDADADDDGEGVDGEGDEEAGQGGVEVGDTIDDGDEEGEEDDDEEEEEEEEGEGEEREGGESDSIGDELEEASPIVYLQSSFDEEDESD